MNKLLCASLLFLLASCISSCSLERLFPWKKRNGAPVSDTTAAVRPVRWANLPAPDTFFAKTEHESNVGKLVEMLTPVWHSRLNYRTLIGKAKVHFEGAEENQDFTANIRVKRDSAIWIDITALGGMVHAARIFITKDSFFLMNYLQKEVTRRSITETESILPVSVDFNSLQNLITGEPLQGGHIVDVAELTNSWMMNIVDDTYLQTVSCTRADSAFVSDQLRTRDPGGPQAVMQFNRYEYSCGRRVSMSRTINVQNKQDKLLLEMDFLSIDFDKEIEMPFSIPNKFTIK